MHTPTGLYVFAGAAQDSFGNDHLRASIFTAPVTGRQPESATMWYVQGGIKRRLLAPSLGPTTLYGEYQKWDDFGVRRSSNSLGIDLTGGEITDTSAYFWGMGVVPRYRCGRHEALCRCALLGFRDQRSATR